MQLEGPIGYHVDPIHRGCILFLVDQSYSMMIPMAGSWQPKVCLLETEINRFLSDLIVRCQGEEEKPRYCFDVGVIGYTTDRIGPSLQGRLSGRDLVGVVELFDNPSEILILQGEEDDDAGGRFTRTIRFPIWYRMPSEDRTGVAPMREALEYLHRIASAWCLQNSDSYPPIVIHLTAGDSTDGDPEPAAAALKSLSTRNGNLLLLNCHLSGSSAVPIAFPTGEGDLTDEWARILFRMSSELPGSMQARLEAKGLLRSPSARGMIFNGSLNEILSLAHLIISSIEVALTAPSEPHLLPVDEVQFTVYRPKTVRPGSWYPMLAFTHLAERRPDAPEAEPDPIEQVRTQAERILRTQVKEFRDTSVDARQTIPRDAEITLLPHVPGVEFNPERRVFRWMKDVHREEFDLRAAAKLDGSTARGRLAAYLGAILLAEVDLAIKVDSNYQPAQHTQHQEVDQARPYRKIFASYSHKDVEIVRQFEHLVRALGDRYLRDVIDLRAGEKWDGCLLQLIDKADVFQLFWSTNSMRSPFVRKEWEHALSLSRPYFIRPTYWEEPLPELPELGLPPETLRQLHFHRLRMGLGQADSIELAPLSDDELKTAPKAKAKPSKPKKSLSATPPTAVKKGDKDIFDDADFEVDVPLSDDSDDKTVQLEAASDFELEESDSGSEVFAIDEEAVDQNAATAMAPYAFAEDDEEEDGFDAAVSSEMTSAWSSSDQSGAAERTLSGLVLSRESEADGLSRFQTIAIAVTFIILAILFLFFCYVAAPSD